MTSKPILGEYAFAFSCCGHLNNRHYTKGTLSLARIHTNAFHNYTLTRYTCVAISATCILVNEQAI